MAVPEVTHLTIERGTDFEATFNISNKFFPLSLSESVVTSRIRKYPTSPYQLTFDWEVDETNRNITIALDSGKTMFLTSGRNYFDVVITKNAKKYSVVKGTIIVEESSTAGAGLPGGEQGGYGIPQNLVELNDVNISLANKKKNYVLVYDTTTNKFTLVDPDVVLSAAADSTSEQPGLPSDFLNTLDIDLDDRIDVDAGEF